MRDLDHHSFTDQRTRIELEFALDEPADALDLVLRNRYDVPVEGHDVDDAAALQDGQALRAVETHEAVTGKQRPVDLLLPILPPAPLRDRREEGFDPLALELLAYDLLVSGSRPDGVPRQPLVH